MVTLLLPCPHSFGIFFKPLITEFGWTRAETSLAFTFSFIVVASLAIIMGRLSDRFGPRLVASLGGLSLETGLLFMSGVGAVWQFYLIYGSLIAIGISSAIPLIALPVRWFVKRRGLMSGIVTGGSSIGTMLIPPLSNWLIANYNWRVCYATLGIAAMVLILPMAQLLRRNPSDIGLVPYGTDEKEDNNEAHHKSGLTASKAIRTREFWMIGTGYFCYNFCLQTVLVHIVLHAIGLGVSSGSAAGIITAIGIGSLLGRFLIGSVIDHFGAKSGALTCFPTLIITLFWLLFTRNLPMLYLFGIVFGIAFGGQATAQSPSCRIIRTSLTWFDFW